MPNKRTRDSIWPLLIGLLAVAIVLAVFEMTIGGGLPAAQASASPVMTESTSQAPTQATSTPDDQATQNAIATYMDIKNQGLTERAIALTEPFPTNTPVHPAGITDDVYDKAMWGKLGFIVQDSWGGVVDGNSVGAFAGAWSTDPTQGAVEVVWVYPLRTLNLEYLTPGKHGSVRITEEHNNRLTLVSTDGTTFYFDFPGLQFVPSLTEVVPTVTPPPTYTPAMPNTVSAPTGYPVETATVMVPTVSPPPTSDPVGTTEQNTPAPTAQSTASY